MTELGLPSTDNSDKLGIIGDVFGGGKGFVPSDTFLDNETYTGDDLPKRMTIDGEGNSIWQNYNNRTDYLIYLQNQIVKKF